ncbi:GPI mannosyltransferase 3 [Nematocida sp. LUAm3]|nr:GPI mannosyltransferase 3 [Nematocida sp. LUAm3]KAI5175706.1 GPI mannosyltransferase 3 [Nematocida sp. LUAm2]KAI5178612.1 GPI mannosyltransferase 3 [Nematocida sp. LUAm1]
MKRKERRGVLFSGLLAYRVVNALLVHTHFEPDEYFQSVEVAMSLILKKKEYTWEWLYGIRTFVFVGIFYFPLLLFKWLCDRVNASTLFMNYSIYLIKIIGAISCSVGDYSTIMLYKNLTGSLDSLPVEVIITTTMNIGQWLYGTRSHVNSFEMNISVYIVNRLIEMIKEKEKNKKINSYSVSACLSALILHIRPTSLFTLLPAWIYVLVKEIEQFNAAWSNAKRKKERGVKYMAVYLEHSRVLHIRNILCFCFTEVFCVLFDSFFYGELSIVPYSFIRLNVLCGLSNLFGTLPFFMVIPFLCVLLGAYCGMLLFCRVSYSGIEVIIPSVYLMAHGIIGHKEMRFLLPVLPYFNVIIAENMKKHLPSAYPYLLHWIKKQVFSKKVFLINLIIGVIIGIDHQNISRPLGYMQREVTRHLETRGDPVFILSVFNPYMLPTTTYLGHKRVVIRALYDNPDLSKYLPLMRRTKRFKETPLVMMEHSMFSSEMMKNLKRASVLEYDYLMINSKYHEELEKSFPQLIRVYEASHVHVPWTDGISIYKKATASTSRAHSASHARSALCSTSRAHNALCSTETQITQ